MSRTKKQIKQKYSIEHSFVATHTPTPILIQNPNEENLEESSQTPDSTVETETSNKQTSFIHSFISLALIFLLCFCSIQLFQSAINSVKKHADQAQAYKIETLVSLIGLQMDMPTKKPQSFIPYISYLEESLGFHPADLSLRTIDEQNNSLSITYNSVDERACPIFQETISNTVHLSDASLSINGKKSSPSNYKVQNLCEKDNILTINFQF